MGMRQRFSKEFKLEAVRLLELGQKPAAQLALELGVRRNQLYKWKEQLAGKGETAFRGAGRKPAQQEGEVARLKRELAKVTEERDILKNCRGPLPACAR
jgi:transposase